MAGLFRVINGRQAVPKTLLKPCQLLGESAAGARLRGGAWVAYGIDALPQPVQAAGQVRAHGVPPKQGKRSEWSSIRG